MWGVEPVSDWRPWQGQLPPEIRVAATFSETDLAVLVGSGAAGSRGRYGVVGLPGRIRMLDPGADTVCSAVDEPAGGLRVLVLGYELGAPCVFLEPRAPPRGQPAGLALDLDAALLVDHAEQRVAAFGPDRARARELLAALDRPVQLPCAAELELTPAIDDREHKRRIRVAQEYIAAGDIYQANVTRRLLVRGVPEAVAALAALSADNPVAHGAYLRAGAVELLSNSMETLVTFDPHSRTARSFPIKGTRRRDQDDAAAGLLLRRDPKERAEHVMIVDLVRNDLGRVAVPGSVRTASLMHSEAYRGVLHGVSAIEATLAPDRTPGDLVAALFPGGSITGAPKRRAMQIIEELEQEPRGFYTGSIGLVAPDGRISMSILIRTLVRDREGWSLQVGGGIVADSTPERELEETWEKVAVFGRVLGRRASAA